MDPLMEALAWGGHVLDTPGSIVRGLVSGNVDRAFGGILDPEQRVSGTQMLQHLGLIGDDPGLGGEIAGIGASILTDPLTLLGGYGAWKGASRLRAGADAGLGTAVAAGRVAEEAAPLARAAEMATPVAEQVAPRIAQEAAPIARAAEEAIIPRTMAENPLSALAEAPRAAPLEAVNPLMEAAAPRELAQPFYSRLEQSAQKMPESVKGESLMNVLKKQGGFSEEEAQFRNLQDLAKPGQRVNKADTLKHLDENQIGVQEKWKGQNLDIEPKYESYQTPGGDNYRELLLTMPEKSLGPQAKALRVELQANGVQQGSQEWHQAFDNLSTSQNSNYKGPHWDEPNILVHVRMNDRVGPNGQKILHIEEMQSDWHQAGKKKGYLNASKEAEQAKLAESYKTLDEQRWATSAGPARDLIVADMHELSKKMQDVSQFVPDAPFKDTWHELAMKRMIRYASENGYDKVTWNTGQAIQKQVGGSLSGQQQFYDQVLPNWVNKYAKKWGVKVDAETLGADLSKGMTIEEAFGGKRLPLQGHGFSITPAMREEVLYKGQPLMNLAGPMGGGAALLAYLHGQQA